MTSDGRIHVKVASYGEGRNLMMTYVDPITGKKVAKTSGKADRGDALKEAGKWEDELNSGTYSPPSKLTWADFRQRYETEKLASLAPATRVAATVALDHLERTTNPDLVAKLTPTVLSAFQAKLREAGMKDTTLARHLRHLKAALRWGESVGLLRAAPKIVMPARAKGRTMMRGRPITTEEYDRMIAAVPLVRPHDPGLWMRLLKGLWLSGLRLGEAVALSWDQDAPFCVWLSGRRPAFRIYAEAQKGHRDQILPMTPDFAESILATPADDREGRVFPMDMTTRAGRPMSVKRIGETISAIGEKAIVVVNKDTEKYASAHDLRRAFGTRWAPRVKPATLQLLMRHASIETTLKYYVLQEADDVADELWAGEWAQNKGVSEPGNTPGNTDQKGASTKGSRNRRKPKS